MNCDSEITWVCCVIKKAMRNVLVFFMLNFFIILIEKLLACVHMPQRVGDTYTIKVACQMLLGDQISSSTVSLGAQAWFLPRSVARVYISWLDYCRWSIVYVFSFFSLSWQLKYISILSLFVVCLGLAWLPDRSHLGQHDCQIQSSWVSIIVKPCPFTL